MSPRPSSRFRPRPSTAWRSTTNSPTRPNFRAWTTARATRRSISSPVRACGRASSASSTPDSATTPTPRPKTSSNTSPAAMPTCSAATAVFHSSACSTTSTSRISRSRTFWASRAAVADVAAAWAITWCARRAAWRRSTPSASTIPIRGASAIR